MKPTRPTVEIRPTDLSPDGLEEVSGLLGAVFPQARHLDLAYLDWFYNQNPVGRALAYNCYSRDRLVGHLAGLPIRAKVHGDPQVGVLGVHAAALFGGLGSAPRPDSARPGLFHTMMETIRSAAEAAGYSFMFGVMNANSASLVGRAAGYQVPGSLDAKIGLGSVPRPGSIEEMQLVRVWDAETLAWRLSRPGASYRVGRRSVSRTVFSDTRVPGLVAEMGRFPDGFIPSSTTRGAVISPLRLWIGLDSTRRWSRSLFFDMPERFRPSPLVVVYRDLSGRGRSLERHGIRVDTIDLDLF